MLINKNSDSAEIFISQLRDHILNIATGDETYRETFLRRFARYTEKNYHSEEELNMISERIERLIKEARTVRPKTDNKSIPNVDQMKFIANLSRRIDKDFHSDV